MRKILQITAVEPYLYALCNDGYVWKIYPSSKGRGPAGYGTKEDIWEKLPNIPQETSEY
jgi:hypothetical protein